MVDMRKERKIFFVGEFRPPWVRQAQLLAMEASSLAELLIECGLEEDLSKTASCT